MSGIHDEILKHIRVELQTALIDSIAEDDPARAGLVILGPLQEDPSQARISVTLHENDPDAYYKTQTSTIKIDWRDKVVLIETGSHTWKRSFVAKARCLLERTKEEKGAARAVASTLRERIETALIEMSFTGVTSNGEYVSRPIMATSMKGEMVQAGGPPNSYDYHIKLMFDLLTTRSS